MLFGVVGVVGVDGVDSVVGAVGVVVGGGVVWVAVIMIFDWLCSCSC